MKSNNIHIRVTEKQKYKIKQEAEKYNLSITEYVLLSINNLTNYYNLVDYLKYNLVDYLKEKIKYYSSINDLELVNVYLDLLFELQHKHF